MERRDYRLVLVMRAVEKITQMMGRSGNELLINRAEVMYRGAISRVPTLSANALRHCAVREPGGLWLMQRYELDGRLSKEALRLLVGGGNNASLKGGAESLRRVVEMQRCWPLLGLMGCGLPDSPKPGVLKFSQGMLVCNETRDYATTISGGAFELPANLRPARLCVGKWTHYRHDPVQQMPGILADPDEASEHSGMIFGGESAISGSLFVSEIHVESGSILELGALVLSLRLWQQAGGFIGGMSNRGNGRTEAMLHVDGDVDLDGAAEAYAEYAESVQDDAIQWLNETYSPAPKEKKVRKKAEATA